jgi:hypothetical protein
MVVPSVLASLSAATMEGVLSAPSRQLASSVLSKSEIAYVSY